MKMKKKGKKKSESSYKEILLYGQALLIFDLGIAIRTSPESINPRKNIYF